MEAPEKNAKMPSGGIYAALAFGYASALNKENATMTALYRMLIAPAICLTAFLMLVVATRGVAAAETPFPALILVEHLGVNIAAESIDAGTGEICGDVAQSLSSAKLGGDPALENAFLLRLQTAITLEFFTVEGISEQGVPIPGESLAKYGLQAGDVYLFKHHVPEGMPNLIVCAVTQRGQERRSCWTPRFSGIDGSLELDPGFGRFSKRK
jgi:hypothetical protein